jgi:inhibitor of KinA
MGDRALLVELGEGIVRDVNRQVQRLFYGLDQLQVGAITELQPGYRSLMVVYDPLKISLRALKACIESVFLSLDQFHPPEPAHLQVPVAYGGEFGPDLQWVADQHHLSTEEVIRCHSSTTYRVYMIGFTPGYPYLGEVPEEIATARRETPRVRVPKGSVGIARNQTGIYPVESPGGWQIIGRTPLILFDPQRRPPALLEAGDQVTFIPISQEEFFNWKPNPSLK